MTRRCALRCGWRMMARSARHMLRSCLTQALQLQLLWASTPLQLYLRRRQVWDHTSKARKHPITLVRTAVLVRRSVTATQIIIIGTVLAWDALRKVQLVALWQKTLTKFV